MWIEVNILIYFLTSSYCMRLKLEKVPERDWMCEECMVKEEIQKEMKGTLGFLKGSSFYQTRKDSRDSGTSNFENCLHVESMDSMVPRSRPKSQESAPQLSAKRPADCLETVPVMKSRTLETITRSTKVPSSHEKGKQAHETSSLGDHSSSNTWENTRLPTLSGHNSSKIPQQPWGKFSYRALSSFSWKIILTEALAFLGALLVYGCNLVTRSILFFVFYLQVLFLNPIHSTF